MAYSRSPSVGLVWPSTRHGSPGPRNSTDATLFNDLFACATDVCSYRPTSAMPSDGINLFHRGYKLGATSRSFYCDLNKS